MHGKSFFEAYVYLNGNYLPKKEATISIDDRGFRFGDGVFETILVKNGKLIFSQEHIQRLSKGLECLKIPYDTRDLVDICHDIIQKNKVHEGRVKITVTRGVGSIGYLPHQAEKPTILVEAAEHSITSTQPIDLWISTIQKISAAALPVHVKTMQGLNQTLARMEALHQNCFEAVMLGKNGMLCEGSSSNIFWFHGNTLCTPALSCGIVDGVIRQKIIAISPFSVKEGAFPLEALLDHADALFVVNSIWGVLPVRCLYPMKKTYATTHQGIDAIKERLDKQEKSEK